ncbi:hypothetical protein PR003_g9601 [Phytophthora rubi]|uniref:Integrase catalytic domain-containing protein n=2 Tax=Phytophthora rubi TaxID=129364 RepID=A0A6A4FGA8_9STRA|nr:hypothetical protein PR003_g9601 [Phytophthora rubi]
MKKRFKLYVDSSRYAVGACLMLDVEGRNRVVAYASKLLTGSQKNWISNMNGISEMECWGIVWATRKFRCYLDKREFDLYTEHQALTWVFSPGNRCETGPLDDGASEPAVQDSVTFVEVMVNGVVAWHGVPSRLLSDNGSNFTSDVAKSFYQTLGIKKLYGAAYHPQTQGLVERFNGTLIGMLRMHVSETQDD